MSTLLERKGKIALSEEERLCANILDRLGQPDSDFYGSFLGGRSRGMYHGLAEVAYPNSRLQVVQTDIQCIDEGNYIVGFKHKLKAQLPYGYLYARESGKGNRLFQNDQLIATDYRFLREYPAVPVMLHTNSLNMVELNEINDFARRLLDSWFKFYLGSWNSSTEPRY